MSGEAVGWAFRKVKMDDPTAKFVLVAICNYADANDKAWPSHEDLARVTGLSKRAVQNNLKKLVDWGVVTRVREFRANGSENNPTVYIDLESRPVVVDGVASGATPPSQEMPPGVESGATLQTTDTKPQKKTRPADGVYAEEFEALWKLYPRTKNTSKQKAHDLWRVLSAENQERVRVAVPLFAADMRAEGRPPDKIKHMQFWLKDRMYETAGAVTSAAKVAVADWHKIATPEQWSKVLVIWRGDSNWRQSWGPEPGKPGCMVPDDLLTESEKHWISQSRVPRKPAQAAE